MDFRNKISILIYLIITVLLIVGGINLKYILDMNNSNNIEQLSYNGRMGGGCMNEGNICNITDILLLNFKRRCFHELQPRNTQKSL